MKIQSKLFGAALAGVVSFAAAQKAEAVATIVIYEDSAIPTITVFDEGAGDLAAGTGAMITSYTGAKWNFTFNTLISKPVSGTASAPVMSGGIQFNRTGTGSSTLVIYYFDTDFGPSDGVKLNSSITFNQTQGSAAYSAASYFSSLNLGGADTLLAGGGPIVLSGNDQFASSIVPSVLPSGFNPYSLTGVVTIVAGAGTKGDADFAIVSTPDGGATLSLLGLSLLGLHIGRRKLRNVA